MSGISGGGGRVDRRTGDAPGSAPFGLEAAMRRIESGDIRGADARLVVNRLRECRSRTARWCESAAALRITDAEREVLATVRDIYASHDDDDSCGRIAAVIDALLNRHANGGGA